MQVEAGVAGQPVTDRRGLVGGEVVADQVHVQVGGDGLVDGDEELAEWNVPDFIDTGIGCQVGEFPES